MFFLLLSPYQTIVFFNTSEKEAKSTGNKKIKKNPLPFLLWGLGERRVADKLSGFESENDQNKVNLVAAEGTSSPLRELGWRKSGGARRRRKTAGSAVTLKRRQCLLASELEGEDNGRSELGRVRTENRLCSTLLGAVA